MIVEQKQTWTIAIFDSHYIQFQRKYAVCIIEKDKWNDEKIDTEHIFGLKGKLASTNRIAVQVGINNSKNCR